MTISELQHILADYMPPSPLWDDPVIDGDYVSLYMGDALQAWGAMSRPDQASALCKGAQLALSYATRQIAHDPDRLNACPLLSSYPYFTDEAQERVEEVINQDWRVYAMWSIDSRPDGWRIRAYMDYDWTPTLDILASYVVRTIDVPEYLEQSLAQSYPWRMFL